MRGGCDKKRTEKEKKNETKKRGRKKKKTGNPTQYQYRLSHQRNKRGLTVRGGGHVVKSFQINQKRLKGIGLGKKGEGEGRGGTNN